MPRSRILVPVLDTGAASETSDFGPSAGRAAIIAGAGPRAVTDPGGGITFTSHSDLATKIAANPTGTTFVAAAGGTFNWVSNVNTGTKRPKIYFLGLAGSTATVIDGGDRSINGISSPLDDPFELHGGTWQNFGNSGSQTSPFVLRNDASAQDFVSTSNYWWGFANLGSDVTVSHAELSSNGSNAAIGTSDTLSDNNVYEYLHLHGNNARGEDPGNFAGGLKLTRHDLNNVVRYCYSHDEYGFGLWCDEAAATVPRRSGCSFEDNVAEDCLFSGVFLEGVSGGSAAYRNQVTDCGYGDATWTPGPGVSAQILVSCADGTLGPGTGIDVSYNIVDATSTSTTHVSHLGLFNHTGHDDDCKDVDFTNNQLFVRSTGRAVGGQDSQPTKTLWTETTNSFNNNEYHVQSLSNSNWRWDSGTGSGATKTYAEWQAYGFDAASTREVI